ncbi:uncharacterized protein si:ch211-80h18.1 [Nematolebias whitei]|uniref:uncharacterized protein si:ch211-80h18.1 n=1 Tax=Nematolebias whitei TaxID=451745 RepID=UPI0018995809|nr:uncharacterized protein si:ch211-80h18.1 [Nematolebias whitei]
MSGPYGVHSESNGNGQKLLNGGGGGAGVDSQTGDLGSLGGEVSHLDYTGVVDPSSHDYLHGLMGGGLTDPFSAAGHVPGHMTPPTHLDLSVVGSGVTAAAEQNLLDSVGGTAISSKDVAHQSAGSTDQSGAGGAALSSGFDQSLSSSLSGSSAVSSSSSAGSAAHREQTDGADSPDAIGNGRQTLLTDRAVTERLVSVSDLQTLQTDLTGGTESVTRLHHDLTATALEFGRDVTERSPITANTESADSVTNTLSPVSGVYSKTDLVTMTADSTGTIPG